MPTALLPTAAPTGQELPTEPQGVTEAFLAALAALDIDAAMGLVADDVVYVNVGFPAVRGRKRLGEVLHGLERPSAGFEVYLHAIAADGPVVLTERTDVLLYGRMRAQFWVCGRFDVHDGKITLWRDAFDFVDIARGTLRGLAAMVLPSLKPKAPTDLAAAPGR